MTDPGFASPGGSPAARASRFVGTFAAILVAIVALFVVDTVLARIDATESASSAASSYEEGNALLRQGNPHLAAEKFGAAVAAERGNPTYALGLAEAMMRDGRAGDAEATLKALLSRSETDGAVNLSMAHVLEQEGRFDEAKAFFHRAIYGRWGADSAQQKLRAKFELIDLLARRGSKEELVAELLPLQETSPDSVALLRRIGHLFVIGGSPARGAAVFREMIRRDPDDGNAHAGLGDAALALGNFRTARADLAIAMRLRPADRSVAERLAIADSALALNPLEPGLGARMRYARALRIRKLAAGLIRRCGGVVLRPDTETGPLQMTRGAAPDSAVIQRAIAAADALWKGRPAQCSPDGSVIEQALVLVLARIGQ